jgi:multiple sugar transport system permease protein
MSSVMSGRKKSLVDTLFIVCMLAPVIVAFVVIRFIPIGNTFVFSFMKRSLLGEGGGFVGLRNYADTVTDPFFWESVSNTLILTVFITLLGTASGLVFALAVNSRLLSWGNFFQSFFFLPVIISMVPATLIWKCLFDYNYGFINYFISFFGASRIEWLINPKLTLIPITVVSVWKVSGYNMMIFLVGLRSIPSMYYEAAAIDGSSSWKSFRRITLPLLKPITLFVLVISLIENLKIFTQAYVMSAAFQASGEVVKTIVYHIYQTAFVFFQMGKASAAAILLLILVFVLTWLQFRLARE